MVGRRKVSRGGLFYPPVGLYCCLSTYCRRFRAMLPLDGACIFCLESSALMVVYSSSNGKTSPWQNHVKVRPFYRSSLSFLARCGHLPSFWFPTFHDPSFPFDRVDDTVVVFASECRGHPAPRHVVPGSVTGTPGTGRPSIISHGDEAWSGGALTCSQLDPAAISRLAAMEPFFCFCDRYCCHLCLPPTLRTVFHPGLNFYFRNSKTRNEK